MLHARYGWTKAYIEEHLSFEQIELYFYLAQKEHIEDRREGAVETAIALAKVMAGRDPRSTE